MSDGRPAPARPDAVVQGPTYRLTVLTSRLLRLEWSATGAFVDERTQIVANRDFETPAFTVTREDGTLEIRTEHLHLVYDEQRFSTSGLSVTLHRGAPDVHHATWHYGQQVEDTPFRRNLLGTARTLDNVDGACELEPGILATYGFATLDDSRTVLLDADGWVSPRRDGGAIDLYLFAHGRDFAGALADYHHLTGPTPLLPRYALGNWWSRYWRYDEASYLELMDDFAEHGLPFSVAVIDMDWHLVDIDPELGTGWTGYTWNHELFPDPARFLGALRDRGMVTTLNVHPADGVRRHEAAYPAMARDLGVDPDTGTAIPFDITSREFVDAYLRHLHHPLEEQGVDFWWLDWQSGSITKIPGLDPLWMLNHIHYLDSARTGRRPLTFSRYAGPGSHRYPVGFSGDTIISWASLDFQPYFTATAANIGFTWWSHDIGGHMFGGRDVELQVRWYQYGVFSPLNRLHSSNSPFTSKAPWHFGLDAEAIMARYLRLRHQLVPYLYSAGWAAHLDGVAVVRPMYHDHPWAEPAYHVPNQSMLGPDLLVVPITSPAEERSGLARVPAWLPPGEWVDLFTGGRYDGDRTVTLFRPLAQLPVFQRAGSVLPLAADPFAPVGDNPGDLVLRVVTGRGAGSSATALVEDDGTAAPTREDRQVTPIELAWETHDDGGRLTLRVAPPSGPGVLTRRRLQVDVVGAAGCTTASLTLGGAPADVRVVAAPDDAAAATLAPALRLDLGEVDLGGGLELVLHGVTARTGVLEAAAFALLDAAEIAYRDKERAWWAVQRHSGLALVQELGTIDGLPEQLYRALAELAAAHTA